MEAYKLTNTWGIKKLEDIGPVVGRLMKMTLPYTVTVTEGEEPRRNRQNRFSHEAYKQVAKVLGDRDSEAVRAESKLHLGVPIMRESSEVFKEKYDRLIKPHSYEDKIEMMKEPIAFPVTSLMSVSTMNEYITRLLRYWDENGASVMLDRYDL